MILRSRLRVRMAVSGYRVAESAPRFDPVA
jgi:hypothetical protein